jgi:hypothetical protein
MYTDIEDQQYAFLMEDTLKPDTNIILLNSTKKDVTSHVFLQLNYSSVRIRYVRYNY